MNFSFVPFGGLIWIFVYVLAAHAQTSASQAGSKIKTVCQGAMAWKTNSRDFDKSKFWLVFFFFKFFSKFKIQWLLMHFSDPKLTIIQRHVADEERLITFLCRAFRNVSLQNSVEKVQTFNRMLTHIYRGRRPHNQSIHTQRLLKIFVKSWTTTMRCSRSQSQKNNKSV